MVKLSIEDFTKVLWEEGIPTYKAGVIQATTYRLLKKLTEESVNQYGISMTQWFIIGTIYDSGKKGVTITELSEEMDTNVPYITNTINLLEQKGIVTKTASSNDSRSKRLTISSGYQKKVKKIEEGIRKQLLDTIYKSISKEELGTYFTVLYKLQDSIEEALEKK